MSPRRRRRRRCRTGGARPSGSCGGVLGGMAGAVRVEAPSHDEL
jgi:hypothetical protein